jgi:hypothetical protein
MVSVLIWVVVIWMFNCVKIVHTKCIQFVVSMLYFNFKQLSYKSESEWYNWKKIFVTHN